MDEDNHFDAQKFIAEMASYIQGLLEKRFPELSFQDKEDILHEIQLKLWKMILRHKKIKNPRAYLGKIIYTTALDMVKKRVPSLSVAAMARNQTGIPFSDQALNATREITPEQRRLLAEAIASLPERRKIVFELYSQGLSLKEIAAKLHWTQHQVRHLFYRGISDLRKKMSGNKKGE